VVGQILVESFVVATLGGTVAVAVSVAAVRVFNSAIPEGVMPYWMHYSMDSRVLLALVAASLVAVFLVGLVPALHASRTDVNSVLKDGGRSATHRRSRRLATAFLAAELAIAIVLVMLVGASWRDGNNVPPSDAAIDTPTVLTASVTLPSAKYPSSEQRYGFYQRLFERLPALGGVSAASAGSFVPLGGAVQQRVEVESDSRADLEQAPTVPTLSIDAGYFGVFALPLRLGRDFSRDDGLAGHESAIVNQRFVDVYLADRNPLGRRIRLTPPTATSVPPSWLTIVGVAENVRPRNDYVEPVVYVPLRAGGPATVSVLMRSSLAPADAATLLRNEVMAIDPTLPLYRVMTMTRAIEDAQWNGRVSHRLLTGLTLIAVLISIVGLYAVTSHAVTQRMQELGIRMALGAGARDVSMLILGRASFQVGLGLLLGLAGTIVWGSVFPDTGQAEPKLLDPAVFAASCVWLAVVTLAACAIPLRRATAIDPVAALRDE
jgi:putative ABC transport system permease protein